jgi:putative DNA primase/helicase
VKPKIRPILQNIPKLLREHKQWCLWIYVSRDEGKRWTKLPLQTNRKAASSTNPETWGTWDEVCKAYQSGQFAGVGYILSPSQEISGIDLDHAIDVETSELFPWADDIVQRLNSYSEISPSGSGVRIFVKGKLPAELGGGRKIDGVGEAGAWGIEAYCKARFVTVTGRKLGDAPIHIEEREETFGAWCCETFPKPKKERVISPPPTSVLDLSDDQLLEAMFRSKSGYRIEPLYRGDLSRHNDNHSSADMALANYLAWWTNGDVSRMDRMFRSSGLMRPKWDERRGELLYGQMTLGLALADLSEGYSPNGQAYEFNLSDLERQEQKARDEEALAAFFVEMEKVKDAGRVFDHLELLARLDTATFAQTKVRLRKLLGTTLNLNDLSAAVADLRKTKPKEEDEKGPTDLELALAWVNEVHERWAFFEGEQWYRYEAGQWLYSSDTFAEAEVQHWLEVHRDDYEGLTVTVRRVANVLRLARNHLGPYPISKLDAHPNWIPLKNGVWDMSTRVLLPHSPHHWLTHQLPFDYDEFAECPRWLKFQHETMLTLDGEECAEWITFNQEWFGYCLIPDNRAQTSICWVGEGGNGKGVATRVLESLLGHRQCIAVPIEQLHEPYHRAELQGKLVGFVNEPDPMSMKRNGSYFKAITGGDSISARRPGERVFTFTPYCRLVISCNSLLETRDLSEGYFRRVIIIEWRFDAEQSPDKDLDLDTKLVGELPGIFNWALEGLERLQKRGFKFPRVRESEKLKADYRQSQDTIAQFVGDECELDETLTVLSRDFLRAYAMWCKDFQAGRPQTSTAIGRTLRKMGFVRNDTRDSRGWRGLQLRPDSVYRDHKLFE